MTATDWKDIPGYEGWYDASRDGRIRSLRTYNGHGTGVRTKELAPLWYRKGYYKVQFGSCGGSRKPSRQYIHRVIYRTFHGEIPDGLTVNHKDGTHDNNHADNLELATFTEQVHHAKAMGLLKSKTKDGYRIATLTAESVREIRRILSETPPPTNQMRSTLAARFGVSNAMVRFIEIRRAWKHI